MTRTGWIFLDETKDVRDCRTHDFSKLIRLAGMNDDLTAKLKESNEQKDQFAENWGITATWTVDSRYRTATEAETIKLFNAIADEPHGVLIWIQNYW